LSILSIFILAATSTLYLNPWSIHCYNYSLIWRHQIVSCTDLMFE
jgi:hypothetical protein